MTSEEWRVRMRTSWLGRSIGEGLRHWEQQVKGEVTQDEAGGSSQSSLYPLLGILILF